MDTATPFPKPQVFALTRDSRFRVSLGEDPRRRGRYRILLEFQGRDSIADEHRTRSGLFLPPKIAGQVAMAIQALARRASEHRLWAPDVSRHR